MRYKMKKILLMVLVLTVFASAQIFRPSGSETRQIKIYIGRMI